MSRIGRAPITLPQGVSLELKGDTAVVKGPKGELKVPVNPRIKLVQAGDTITLERASDHRSDRAQHGLTRSLLNNAVTGVSQGFSRQLEIQGVGYRAAMKGSQLELSLGFSHPVVVEAPEGVTLAVPEPTRVTVSGIDKQLVGQVAANIRSLRPPDAYHGKGVRYQGEQIRLKPGKTAAR